jgi:phenylalanyl-tRNA synthetase alpha chain
MPTEPEQVQAPPNKLSLSALDRDFVEAREAIGLASTLGDLDEVETRYLGKRSQLSRWKRELGSFDEEGRRRFGAALNTSRERLEATVAQRRADLSRAARAQVLAADRLDLSEVLPQPGPGHLHPVTKARWDLEEIFVGMGYEVAEGADVETDWYNFTALNIGPGHPVRSAHDSFYVELGEEDSVLLRTHTSPVQIHLLERGELPIYAVAPGRVYRRDTADATHLPYFNQLEALVVDRGITFGDLAGTIDTFVAAIFGKTVRARLRPGYFPFTEPSAEFDISCAICDGRGCRTCGGVGWVELGGCGLVHPAVFEATGVDPEVWSGFAFGFGIDRIAMMRHDVDDLRSFVENDIRFLRQF